MIAALKTAWAFVSGNPKTVAVAAVLVALAFGVGFWQGIGYGKDNVKAAVGQATTEHMQQSQQGVINAARKLQDAEDAINASPPSDDGALAPVLRGQLDRMRNAQH